ncbi:MAG: AraC family transcriptional regulator [Clostridiaceae bacterium]|nr:AraC family transcriptional regulator [Eubacteriales bacterium]
MAQESRGEKRGYLHEDFRLFHIRDRRALELDYHYHEFDKIVVFLSGKVTYLMEGKSYFLAPYDILLVSRDQIHRPVIDTSEPYERVVLWMNTSFLAENSFEDGDLFRCFKLARERGFALLRLEANERFALMRCLKETEDALSSKEFAHDLLARVNFLRFLIELNRVAYGDQTSLKTDAYRSDPRLNDVIAYINANLDGDLSLDALCAKFFISKSHLMHRFKELAGCTAHGYIRQKRLLRASELIRAGATVSEACARSGFGDYSAFLKAFKSMFGCVPSELG